MRPRVGLEGIRTPNRPSHSAVGPLKQHYTEYGVCRPRIRNSDGHSMERVSDIFIIENYRSSTNLRSRASVCGDGKGTNTDASALTHCGRVTQICVFNTVKLGTSANSP